MCAGFKRSWSNMDFGYPIRWIAMLTSALCTACGGGGSMDGSFSLSVNVAKADVAIVSWSPYPESNSYRVVRNGEQIINAVRDMSYTDRGLLAGARYCYVVRARGSGGASDASSNEVCVTMPKFGGGPNEAVKAGKGLSIAEDLSAQHMSTNQRMWIFGLHAKMTVDQQDLSSARARSPRDRKPQCVTIPLV